jgi:hypothetical protein
MNIQVAYTLGGKIYRPVKAFVSRPIAGEKIHIEHDGGLLQLRAIEFHHCHREQIDVVLCSVADENSVEAFEAAMKEVESQ